MLDTEALAQVVTRRTCTAIAAIKRGLRTVKVLSLKGAIPRDGSSWLSRGLLSGVSLSNHKHFAMPKALPNILGGIMMRENNRVEIRAATGVVGARRLGWRKSS